MRRILSYFSISILFIGVLGFIFNMLLGIGLLKIKGELPLCRIQKIQEKNKCIYIGLGWYNRVQVYTENGKFLKSIPVNTFIKDFDFYVNQNGSVNSYITIQNLADKINFEQYNGVVYKIKSKIPFVISKTINNKSHEIIKQPIWFNLFAGPVSSWLVALTGVVITVSLNVFIIMDVFGLNLENKEKLKILRRRIFLKD